MSFDNDDEFEDDESQADDEATVGSDLEEAGGDDPQETSDEPQTAEQDGIGDEPQVTGDESASSGGRGQTTGDKFCSNCGSEIDAAAEICPECGVRQGASGGSEEKDPAIAALLSFVIVGAGQVYNGQIAKGIGFFVGMSVAAVIALFGSILILPLFLPLPVWGFAVYDAYDQAQKINAGAVSV